MYNQISSCSGGNEILSGILALIFMFLITVSIGLGVITIEKMIQFLKNRKLL